MMMRRFDSKALYVELNKQRLARGLSWRQVAEATGVSATTISRTKVGARLEVDGMLAMVAWLGMAVEDFVRETAG